MKKIISLLIFSSFFILFLLPPKDPDLGWEIRCGELVIKSLNFCTPDRFSLLMPGYNWINNRWIFQVLVYSLNSAFGIWGISLAGACIFTLTLYLLFNTWKSTIIEKAIAGGIIYAIAFSNFVLGLRAQSLTTFYFALTLFILERTKTLSWKKYCLFLVLMLVWVNSHGGFILGLGIISLRMLDNSIGRLPKLSFQSIKELSLIPSLFLVSLINPFFAGVYEDIIYHQAQSGLDKIIAEWVPPSLPMKLMIAFFFLFLTILLLLKPTRHKMIKVIELAGFMYLAITARRHLPYFFIMFFTVLFSSFPYLKISHGLRSLENRSLYRKIMISASACVLALLLIYFFPSQARQNSDWHSYCYEGVLNFPCNAVDFIRKNNLDGNFFDTYEWGGFLVWQLPNSKVFVDGRMPAWRHPSGKSPYTIFLETIRTENGWVETLTANNVNRILINRGTFMDLALRNTRQTQWKKVFEDNLSTLYVNNN